MAQLWKVKDIADFLRFCETHVRANILSQDTFPDPIYLTDSERNPRWDADEVRSWVTGKTRRSLT